MTKRKSTLKRIYWLNIGSDFFQDPVIKKLRKTSHGDASVCVYLKLMLTTLETNGTFVYEKLEDSLEKELALKLDEKLENIQALFTYLIANSLLIKNVENENSYTLIHAQKMIECESESLERVRRHRAKISSSNALVTPCNGIVTECNGV